MKDRHARKVGKRTTKLIDRLTYSPAKHKRKEVRKLLKTQQEKQTPLPKSPTPKNTLKFGSFNVNGLDLEAGWAIEQLLTTRGFDVSYIKISQQKLKPISLRNWPSQRPLAELTISPS